MGFFDGLFGGGKVIREVSLAELDSVLEGWQESEAKDVLAKAKPFVEQALGLVSSLKRGLDELERAGFHDIDPRYDKIVRTAKPSYVKSMRHALSVLEYKGGGLDGVRSFETGLAESLDTLGKVSFGDGKFLPFAFQEQMNKIQGDCRRLLKVDEELKVVLSSNTQIASLGGVRRLHAMMGELHERAGKIKIEADRNESEAAEGDKRLLELSIELERLHVGEEFSKVSAIKDRLTSLEAEASGMDSAAHMAVSPVKSALRKYEKLVVDPKQSKLIEKLQENPLEAYISSPHGDVEKLFDGLESACHDGSISLKDHGKTTSKIKTARSKLSRQFKARWVEVGDEMGRLRGQVENLPVVESERKLLAQIHSTQQQAEKNKADAVELRAKATVMEEESGKVLADLKSRLQGMDVELKIS